MKMKKRLLSILLSLALVLMPGMSLTAYAVAPQGTEILNESFTNGIPSTWTSSTGDYHFEAKDGYVWANANNGEYKAFAYLYSPVLDLSDVFSATLVFNYKKPRSSSTSGYGADDCIVYYRINGGELKQFWSDTASAG